jgi:proteasome lid subunit RPN8/RPN11
MILIKSPAEQVMNEDAVKAYPDECCGFMYGVEESGGNRVVSMAIPVHNSSVENRQRRFEISPKDYLKAEKYALENDLLLLGIYHSHPDHPAVPSEHDRIAAQPWFSYIIISVLKGEVSDTRSWVLNEQSIFDEERIHQNSTINK